MAAIETTGLTKYYGDAAVVEDVALKVPEACIYGFVGPNGAGKTTVMRMLLGLIIPDRGKITVFGNDVCSDRHKALTHVGAVIESPSMYGHLTGRANLLLTCTLLRLQSREVDRVLDLVDLTKAASQKVATYSLGMKQRLAIGRALLGTPRLLLLDEPTNGLDPDGIISMRAFIRELPERIAGTVFISSHLLSEVEQIADHVGLMKNGRLLIQDSMPALIGASTYYAISIDNPSGGTKALIDAGFNAVQDGDHILLMCTHDHEPGNQAAYANRILVEAGHAVSGLAPLPVSLEEIYRSVLTRDWPPLGIAA